MPGRSVGPSVWFVEREAEYSSSDRKLVLHLHSAVMGSTCIQIGYDGREQCTTLFWPHLSHPTFPHDYYIFSSYCLISHQQFCCVFFPFCSFPVLQFLSRLLSNRCLLVPPHFGWVVLCPTTAVPCGTSSTWTWGSALNLSCSENQTYSVSIRNQRKVKNHKAFLAPPD